MGLKELAELVTEMRTAQKNYFKSNYSTQYEEKQKWLQESKTLEREVDLQVKKILAPQKELF